MKRGEIWIASLDPRRGVEVGKQRPVVILQTDYLNDLGHPTVVVAPISSQQKGENILRLRVENEGLNRGAGYILVDQVRALDVASRLKKKVGKLRIAEMSAVSRALGAVLEISR